jgi:hypothetical protein
MSWQPEMSQGVAHEAGSENELTMTLDRGAGSTAP